jgi:hypothetical protein
MQQNVGTIDMIARIVLAAFLLYVGFMDNPIVSEGTPKMIVGIAAFVPLLTGALKFCPLYMLIGFSTRK